MADLGAQANLGDPMNASGHDVRAARPQVMD